MTDEVKITQTAHDLMFSDTLTKEEVHRILVTNSTSEFDKLRGVPGIAVDPIPWDTASNLVKENTVDSLAKLGRSPSGIVEYWTFKEKVAREFASVVDHIKISVLLEDYTVLPDGRKQAVPADPKSDRKIVWRVNDFPYNYEEGVEHHVLWSTQPLERDEIEEEIRKRREGYETVYYINPPALMSIPLVWHCHVLSRKAASA